MRQPCHISCKSVQYSHLLLNNLQTSTKCIKMQKYYISLCAKLVVSEVFTTFAVANNYSTIK